MCTLKITGTGELMFTTSQQPQFEESEGSLLFGALFGSVLGDAFGEAVEQAYEAVDFVCDIREDRANDCNRGSKHRPAPTF
jgi:hypothetical protein